MKKIVAGLLTLITLTASIQAQISPEIPPSVVVAFQKNYHPHLYKIQVEAKASANGITYYQLIGKSKKFPDDALGTFADNGKTITQVPSDGENPCYTIKDQDGWRALQADWVKRQTELEGKETVQKILDERRSFDYEMAKSYQDAGYKIHAGMALFKELNDKNPIKATGEILP